MRKQILVGLVAAIMFLFFNHVVVSNGYAANPLPKKNGTFCWNIDNTILEWSGTLHLRISNIGDGHYLCSGTVNLTYPFVMQFPTYGNVEFVEDKIYITLSLAGIRNEVMGIDMYKIILDPASLNGTFEGFGVYIDATEHSGGTVTHISCK